METDKYRAFLKVLECQSFTQAAIELGYTQSAISHSVYSLEHCLGFKLMMRERGKVTLTPAGKQMLPLIRGIVNAQENLEQNASNLMGVESGNLYIASINSIAIHWFPGLLKQFGEKYPKIQITILQGNYSGVEDYISSGTVDCGFLSMSPNISVPCNVFYREKLVAVMPPDHPLLKKDTLRLRDLEGETFIMPGEGANHQVGNLIKQNNMQFNVKYSVRDDDLTIAMIAKGLGITILPEMSYKDYLNFQIGVRDLEEAPYRDIGIGYLSWDDMRPVGRLFVSFVLEYFDQAEIANREYSSMN